MKKFIRTDLRAREGRFQGCSSRCSPCNIGTLKQLLLPKNSNKKIKNILFSKISKDVGKLKIDFKNIFFPKKLFK